MPRKPKTSPSKPSAKRKSRPSTSAAGATERRSTRSGDSGARRTASHWLQSVFEHSSLGIALLDRSAHIVEANAAFSDLLGRNSDDLAGHSVREFAAAEDSAAIVSLVAEVSAGGNSSSSREMRFVRPDAQLVWGSMVLSRAGDRREDGIVAVVQDISARKALEAELLHQAFHDSLTGLANRALFLDRIDHAIMNSMREPERIGVLFIDLDDFKLINDTQGHAAGDRVLQRVGITLLNATRGCDTVCRLGGDEFAVLLERVNQDEGPEVAAQRIVNALARPIEVADGRTVTVGASIGIAMRIRVEDREDLLRNADVALYEAKNRARGRWVVYDPAMHAALVDKVALEVDLRAAIERCQLTQRPGLEKTGTYPRFNDASTQSQISLAYQPIVEMSSERLTGFEALLRWTHPERGIIAPSTFVPVAEETGLVLALGRWVLRTACRQAAAWNTQADAPITVTVNLSGRQLQDEALTLDVEAALRESGLDASNLILEMTESVIMHESSTARARLRELKQLGVRIAIDDFGTGYSSLSHLQQFPVDILKIDRSFLHKMHQGPNDTALVRTIIALAKLLSLRTIAEGVEDSAQQQQLRELGCDSAQGFLFGRPMSVAEAESMMASVAAVADGNQA
jgi:diguanylate cyclase (GGDEF)-like protein/PAS domain S-box-containing protein